MRAMNTIPATNPALRVSVVICTHNPDPERLRRVLLGLKAQTLPVRDWEIVIVDNASAHFPPANFFASLGCAEFRCIRENRLGLTSARLAGLREARGDFVVLVDDDNVLAPDYLATVLDVFTADARLGATGGRSLPEFEAEPPAWCREFFPLLALRDLGSAPQIAATLRPAGATRNEYPAFAPIGAGMALRREAWTTWLEAASRHAAISDRSGNSLSSGGDNDIVLTILGHGWHVGYCPRLALSHLIPATRLRPDYLARLNRGIQKSWVEVLGRHAACPWSAIRPETIWLRKLKAWFVYHGWSHPSGYVRWHGACGHFEGRANLAS
jgi:glycosyltransferase involved in cell wall biosynthesis